MKLGTFVTLADPALAELVAERFDFVWLDLEHSALDVRDVEALAIVCQGRDCSCSVRLPRHDSERLPAIVDAGVDAVVAPMIETAEQAAAFASRLSYPPRGIRGYGPRRVGRHGLLPRFWERSEARAPGVVQIETPIAVERADEIAATEGIDALCVGTADLALGLGIPGQLDALPIREAIEKVSEAARVAGKSFGIAAGGDPASATALALAGADFLLYSLDARVYAAALDKTAKSLAEASGAAGLAVSERMSGTGG